jgi:hypothetical protein
VLLPRQINDTNRAINDLQDQADAARKLLPVLRAQSEQATNAAAAKQAALTLAQKRAELAQAGVNQTKEAMWQAVQGTPEYAAVVARQRAAREKFEALRQACWDALAKTAAFKAAQNAADVRQSALDDLKGQKSAELQKVTDAATEVLKARTVVEMQKREAVANDAGAAGAYKELQTAVADLAARRAAFEKGVMTDPAMTPLLDQLDAAKAALAGAAAEFKVAKTAAAEAQGQWKQVQNEDTRARAGLLAAQNNLARLQGALSQADIDLRDAEARLDLANDARARTLQAREVAIRVFKDKQQQEDRLRRGA